MPNWCRTTIHARNAKQYQEIIADLKNHNVNPSFNNITPMPPELRLQESSIAGQVVLIYVNALAVKLVRFNRQHDTADATEIKNKLKAYQTSVANMEDAFGFDERLYAINVILTFSDTNFPLDEHSFKDMLTQQCQNFTDYQLQAHDDRSKLKELIDAAIILPPNASHDPDKLVARYHLTANDKWLDPDLKAIPYLTILYHLGKQYFDNVVNYGAETWYGWSTRYWGTKWDLSEYAADDHTNTIMFNTAWTTPAPILKQLATRHGKFTIDVDSESTADVMHVRVTKDALENID